MRGIPSQVVLRCLPIIIVSLLALPLSPAAALQRGEVVIDGRITIAVDVARSLEEQAKGLGGRSSLKKGTGMVFPYREAAPRSFWMKGMLIPIDILWIQGGKIVAIEANVPPPSSNTPVAVFRHVADLVLEVPAGFAGEMNIHVGQPVKVRYNK